MRSSRFRFFALWLALGPFVGCGPEGPPDDALQRLRDSVPGVRVRVDASGERIVGVYGSPVVLGADSAEASAAAFVETYAEVFGVPAAEVVPAPLADSGGVAIPGVASDSGPWLRSLRYRQERGGYPVYGAELRVQVRDSGPFPVVRAVSSLRDLGDFVPREVSFRIDVAASRAAAAEASAQRRDFSGGRLRYDATREIARFSTPEPVIWTGRGGEATTPVMAFTYVGDNSTATSAAPSERWRFVAGAETRRILDATSLNRFADATGTIRGYASDGPNAMRCDPTVESPLPSVEVQINFDEDSVFADADGRYTALDPGAGVNTVSAQPTGEFFDVVYWFDTPGFSSTRVVTQNPVPAPQPTDLALNDAADPPYRLAEVNGYAHAQEIRRWVLTHSPTFPGLSDLRDFRVVVNDFGPACPGNARIGQSYDFPAIFLCGAGVDDDGDDHVNYAFGSVVAHEIGHFLAILGGASAFGAYGEGIADVVSLAHFDSPRLGGGDIVGDCTSLVRSADNGLQFGQFCEEEHDCGRLLSGIFWSIRNELVATEPAAHRAILSRLALGSILMRLPYDDTIHSGIAIDLLVLDDDDDDLTNGTPHAAEICAGFAAHGLACPPFGDLDADYCVDDSECAGDSFCSSVMVCTARECQDSGVGPCAGNLLCDESADECYCTDDSQCDDGDFCNGAETCVDRSCQSGTATPCGPGETCVPLLNLCIECDPFVSGAASECDDGDFCNGIEVCSLVGECLAPPTLPCRDDEICDPDQKRCRCREDSACDDANSANGTEYCGPDGDCLPGVPPNRSPIARDDAVSLYDNTTVEPGRRVTGASTVEHIAGNDTDLFPVDGALATQSGLVPAWAAAADATGNVYVASSGIHRVAPNGRIRRVARSPRFGVASDLRGMALGPSGDVFVANRAGNVVQRTTPFGVVTTVAGNGVAGFSGDGGSALAASLSGPVDVTVDAAGDLSVADAGNNRIRKVTLDGGIETVAGSGPVGVAGPNSTGDGGAAIAATLSAPAAVAVDAGGTIYFSDVHTQQVRAVGADGLLRVVAGSGDSAFSGDGGAATAAGMNPVDIAIDSRGNLVIADAANFRIRRVDAGGDIHPVMGTGAAGQTQPGGRAAESTIWGAPRLASAPNGDLIVLQVHHGQVYRVAAVVGDVLANDSDPDGDPLTAVLVDPPTIGTLELQPDGGFRYTPEDDFVGEVTFTYVARDADAESAPATVTVTVVAR